MHHSDLLRGYPVAFLRALPHSSKVFKLVKERGEYSHPSNLTEGECEVVGIAARDLARKEAAFNFL